MPFMFNVDGYKIYFWANERGEPIHVHISRGKPTGNSTKVWLTSNGGVLLSKNSSRIPKKDLYKLMNFISANRVGIVAEWINYFGTVSYYM